MIGSPKTGPDKGLSRSQLAELLDSQFHDALLAEDPADGIQPEDSQEEPKPKPKEDAQASHVVFEEVLRENPNSAVGVRNFLCVANVEFVSPNYHTLWDDDCPRILIPL